MLQGCLPDFLCRLQTSMHIPCKWLNAGFTIVELVMVIVVLGIISVYAVTRSAPPAEVTLPSQAQKMASDIRHAQTLATTWGRRLRITITEGANGTYNVSCVTAGAAPCNANPVIDPATGNGFNVALQQNVQLAGTATLDFNSLGQPTAAANYTLTSGTAVVTVTVAALTGYVTVAP